ncbi:MAG TPA: DNA-binding protein [Planctomycetota bacterium]|nr:DNA-binding protein [Planctomycetota bacterium]
MTITLSLSDDREKLLKTKAAKLGISVEELVLLAAEKFPIESDREVGPLDEDFKRAADYVLNKNKELYRRLA